MLNVALRTEHALQRSHLDRVEDRINLLAMHTGAADLAPVANLLPMVLQGSDQKRSASSCQAADAAAAPKSFTFTPKKEAGSLPLLHKGQEFITKPSNPRIGALSTMGWDVTANQSSPMAT